MRTKPQIDIAIMVALSEEFQTLIDGVPEASPVRRLEGGYDYLFELSGRSRSRYQCIASMIGGMGPDLASLHTSKVVSRWKPGILFVVGLAAGVHKDVELGDVVVADQVDAYLNTTKAVPTDGGFAFEHRGCVHVCDPETIDDVRHFPFVWRRQHERFRHDAIHRLSSAIEALSEDMRLRIGGEPQVHVAHIASGPVVSASEEFVKWLKTRDASIHAIEMESAGVLSAVRGHKPAMKVIVVRGISDLGDSRKAELDAGTRGVIRRYAMQNALGFARAMIASHLIGPPRSIVKDIIEERDLASMIENWLLNIRLADITTLRVLVVDDDPQIRHIIVRMLSRAGAHVFDADDGSTAENTIATNAFDLVVTDVNMPTSGFELVEAIRESDPNIPVILLTGFRRVGSTLPDGADLMLKPFDSTDLVWRICSLARDEQWTQIRIHVPLLNRYVFLLGEIRRTAAHLVGRSLGSQLLDAAIRHKLKDAIREFAQQIAAGEEVFDAVHRLLALTRKLEEVVNATSHGVGKGLVAYLTSIREDLLASYRQLRLELISSGDMDADLPSELMPLLLLCAVELIDNARTALRSNGTVRVSVSRWTSRPVLTLSVWSDSGPIHPSVKQRLFAEGVSTNGPGRGLGLSLIRQFADRIRGKVEVFESDPREVEFVLTVPLSTT